MLARWQLLCLWYLCYVVRGFGTAAQAGIAALPYACGSCNRMLLDVLAVSCALD